MASITTYSKRWQQPESEENMLKYKCLSAKTVNTVLHICYSFNQKKRKRK